MYNDTIKQQQVDDTMLINFVPASKENVVSSLAIKVKQNTQLQILYTNDEKTKLDILIEVEDGVTFSLGEIRTGNQYKVCYRYTLKKQSQVYLNRFHYVKEIKEYDAVSLEGEEALFESIIKTVSTNEEKYEMIVNHKASKTKSFTVHHAVNKEDGEMKCYITNEVPKGIKGCEINQKSQIITMNHKECTIKPILLIDEEDVIAEHAAHIGTFEEDSLFYLESRGLSRKKATELMIKGFLQKGITLLNKDTLQEILKK